MRLSTLAVPALFSSFTLATTIAAETVSVSDLNVRNINGVISSANFTVKPANVVCSAPSFNTVIKAFSVCGESQYRFSIEEESFSSYNVTIYQEIGTGFGTFKDTLFDVICRDGEGGALDQVCQQDGAREITLSEVFGKVPLPGQK